MRPFPLTTLQGGINRLSVKGSASANRLYDFVNGYLTTSGWGYASTRTLIEESGFEVENALPSESHS